MMRRGKITPEQFAAIKARRRALLEAAKSATDKEKKLLAALSLVNTEGHNLSAKNALLIAIQAHGQGLPIPSIVGGFKQWRTRGRVVAKGQKGLAVCFPRISKQTDAEGGESEHIDGYSWGVVFDISQTVPAGSEKGKVNMAEKSAEWAQTWADLGAADLALWKVAAKDDGSGVRKTPVTPAETAEETQETQEQGKAEETQGKAAAVDSGNGGNIDAAALLAAFTAA